MTADWRLPEPIKDFALVQSNECFIAGGLTENGPTNAVYVLNENGPVRQLPPMLEDRAQHSLILIEGESDNNAGFKLFAIGGSNSFIEYYDSITNRWQILNMQVPTDIGVFGAVCCLLPSGMVLIAGG